MLRGIIFDLDGTLVRQALDFEAIRREIGLPSKTPLLEALAKMPVHHRTSALAIIDRHECLAAANAELLPGVCDFLQRLDARGVRRAIFTRNSRASVCAILDRCRLVGFEPLMTRDDGPFKPDPQGIWQICTAWDIALAEALMLGDYLYDIQAGRAAGCLTALVTHGRELPFANEADILLQSLEQIPAQLWNWFTT